MFNSILLVLFGLWFVCSFFAIPVEDGSNNSFIPKFSYQIAKLIMFSLNFWYKFLNTFFAFIFALFTPTFILSFITYLIVNFKNNEKFIKNEKKFEIVLEIEKNRQFGVLFVVVNKEKEKILRFKSEIAKNYSLGNSNICKSVAYFIK